MSKKSKSECLFSFYIEYIDEKGVLRNYTIKPYLLNEDDYKYNPNPSLWFFEQAAKFENAYELANSLMDRYAKVKAEEYKNPDSAIKTYASQYKIKDFKCLELIINDRYVGKFDKFYCPSSKEGYTKVPIMYADAYKSYPLDSQDQSKQYLQLWRSQIIDDVQRLDVPLYAFKNAIHSFFRNYSPKNEKNPKNDNSLREFSFRMVKYIADFIEQVFKQFLNDFDSNPHLRDNYYEAAKKEKIKSLLKIKNSKVIDFLKAVFNDPSNEDILLSGNGSCVSNKYYIFISNFVNQIQSYELARGLDATKLFKGHFTKYGSDFNTSDEIYKVLFNRSVITTFNISYSKAYNPNWGYSEKEYCPANYDSRIGQTTPSQESEDYMAQYLEYKSEPKYDEQTAISELLESHRILWPDLSDEEILNLALPGYFDSEDEEPTAFSRKNKMK